jgi:O-antigen/teichoic acid export membrane protein
VAVVSFAVPEHLVLRDWLPSLSAPNTALYRMLIPIGFFCLGGYYIALYMATRAKEFRPIAMSRLSQGIVGPLSQIGLALVGGGAPGLLIGSVLGQSAGTFGLLHRIMHPNPQILKAITFRRMVAMAARYRRFPLIGSWTALLDSVGGNQLLYLMATTQYSPKIAGFIFLVERVIARPLSMVGTSVMQVYVGEVGRTVTSDPDRLMKRFRQVVLHQFVLATGWIIVANIAAAGLFPTVFGANWSDAVIYLQVLSVGYLAQAVVLPVFHTLQLLERQGLAATWQILRLLLTIAVFGLSIRFDISAPIMILSYSVVQALACIALIVLMALSIGQLQKERHPQ